MYRNVEQEVPECNLPRCPQGCGPGRVENCLRLDRRERSGFVDEAPTLKLQEEELRATNATSHLRPDVMVCQSFLCFFLWVTWLKIDLDNTTLYCKLSDDLVRQLEGSV